ncbi:hypothetical protein F0919_08865 [Taibaiella lutea]|uniref:Alpha-L-arabinofuranosidase B catalytic domain-containing protein n=1 Tax=Taibaiella lutea TaxID=2608001 RepID=A0A5M6CN50_9BACT|nr:hypothetical protein [Taibaiella lutea]KAA5534715.1 hypothetical protein F0919_08865 [Taibaiella lutea]
MKPLQILFCLCFFLSGTCFAQTPIQKFWALNQNKTKKTALDSITGASMAYSVRKLRGGYTGPAMRVRKGTGTALARANVSFNAAGVVDTNSIITIDSAGTTSGYTVGATMSFKTFYGTASIFVDTWYDQSGNARHVKQTIENRQPRIVNAGAIEVENSRTSIWFTSSYLQATTAATAVFGSGYIGTAAAVLEASNSGYAFGYSSGNSRWLSIINFSGSCYLDVGNTYKRISGVNNTVGSLRNYMMLASSTSPYLQILVSGASIASTTTLIPASLAGTATTFTIGGDDIGGGYHAGHESELIIFPTVLTSTERNIIDNSQSTFFGTP